jgi:hypothetical protein
MKIKRYKIERVREEFARLGRVCDVMAVTGYSRSLVSAIINGRAEASKFGTTTAVNNSCDMDKYPAQVPGNYENFGELQYIIDRLPAFEQAIVTAYFVHETPMSQIATEVGVSADIVARILKNLHRIDLIKNEPRIIFRKKFFNLEGLSECCYRIK